MSDESLREHERRWLESGDPSDEATWLLARLRAGDLDRLRLRLAAYLGSAGAHLALGDLTPRVPDDLLEWVKGLSPGLQRYTAWTRGDPEQPWAKEVLVRVGAAALWVSLPLWELAEPEDGRPADVLDAVEGWAADPTPERVAAVIGALGGPTGSGAEVAEHTSEVMAMLGLAPGEAPDELDDPLSAMLLAAGFGANLVTDDSRAQQVAAVVGTLVTAVRQPFEASTTALIATSVGQAARATSDAAVRGAVASRVVPWALGRSGRP